MNNLTILIVEDNPISRKVLKMSLESEKYNVVEAQDGKSALMLANEKKFDLIIQDLFLPDMDGFALNNQLRMLPNTRTIPIFALSGFLSQSEDQVKHKGFTTFLLKPIEPSYLLHVVKAHLPSSAPSNTSAGKGKRILLVDDNAIQLKLFSMQLRNVDFEVMTASDGVLALNEARKMNFDAIISDILMPNMDGFSLCSEVRRDPKLCNIPVILLTSHYLEDEDLELAKKVGASSYLTRTPEIEKLIHELLKVLSTKSPIVASEPIELTQDVKENHFIRSMRQLEQQVLDNTRLAQRCSMLMSQLYLVGAIADTLSNRNQNTDGTQIFKQGLYYCLDATGLSKGALFIQKHNSLVLDQKIGFTEDQKEKIEEFFGIKKLIPEIIKNNKPYVIPSEECSGLEAENFLNDADVKSALILPLHSGSECFGILLLGSNLSNLTNDNIKEFVSTLGTQFGQSIALSSAFDKVASSEKKYRQLVEISPDAIFIQQEGKFVYANNSALALLGVNSIDDLTLNSLYEYFPADYHAIIKQQIDQNIHEEFSLLQDVKIKNTKGDFLDVEIVLSPFIHNDKSAIYMIMRDITESKLSALHLKIQYEIAWILAESQSLFISTGKILKMICEYMKWDYGIIWAVDKEENVLRYTRSWQAPTILNDAFQRQCEKLTYKPGAVIPGLAWEQKKAIWKSDITHDSNYIRNSSAAIVGLNTGIAFPVLHEKEVIGVIEFYSKDNLHPNQESLQWFESIGNQFGIFLKRKHMERQMLYLSEHDVLTGLSNRRLLEQYLNTDLTEAMKNKSKLAVLFLDIDHFKYVNDSMGHESGDILLKEISDRLSRCLRLQDRISRLGGDEFVIILPDIHQKTEIIEIIGRLQKQLSNQVVLKNKAFKITSSIGISLYPEDGDTVQSLIKCADIAMYAAKNNGRNNYQFCTREMTLKAENRGILQNDLQNALKNNEFILHYQPKIDTRTQKVAGMEALIRWQKGDALLQPVNFISAIENSDLINPVTEWVFKTACLQNKSWQSAGLPTIAISINLSPRNLNQLFLSAVEKILKETDLKPDSFEIEITEGVLMENVENNILILNSLKEMGIKISIDDFGTGYSSLSYLKRFPIDTIKIDQSFVHDIATDKGDEAIVTAIIAMSHSMGFKVVAEGVETEEQLKFLCEHQCDEIQGYYFSRPLPVSEATEYIKNPVKIW